MYLSSYWSIKCFTSMHGSCREIENKAIYYFCIDSILCCKINISSTFIEWMKVRNCMYLLTVDTCYINIELVFKVTNVNCQYFIWTSTYSVSNHILNMLICIGNQFGKHICIYVWNATASTHLLSFETMQPCPKLLFFSIPVMLVLLSLKL